MLGETLDKRFRSRPARTTVVIPTWFRVFAGNRGELIIDFLERLECSPERVSQSNRAVANVGDRIQDGSINAVAEFEHAVSTTTGQLRDGG